MLQCQYGSSWSWNVLLYPDFKKKYGFGCTFKYTFKPVFYSFPMKCCMDVLYTLVLQNHEQGRENKLLLGKSDYGSPIQQYKMVYLHLLCMNVVLKQLIWPK